jgi:uncharacterized RDD family membrane protein YckC
VPLVHCIEALVSSLEVNHKSLVENKATERNTASTKTLLSSGVLVRRNSMRRRFEAVRTNSALQNLWIRRVIAFAIDSLVLLVVFAAFNAALAIALLLPLFVLNVNAFSGLFSGFWAIFGIVVVWGYYVALEGSMGATIGKRFMDLKVRSLRGAMSYTKAFVRSFSKAWLPLFAFLFVLDLIIGFLTQGDPRQRFSDVLANTAVYHTPA